MFPGEISENWERFFYPTFPDLNTLRNIVQRHGREVLFQSFDQEGLRVDPLVLSVDPNVHFNMQLCRFVRKDILISLRELIDQFVSEGVVVPDSSCSHGDCSKKRGWYPNGGRLSTGKSIFKGLSTSTSISEYVISAVMWTKILCENR